MNLLDLTPQRAERVVADWVAANGFPAYRVKQILPRLWQRPVREWCECSDLPRKLIELLEAEMPLCRPKQVERRKSSDGTVKYLWGLGDDAAVESVVLIDRARRTVCISTQVGCAYKCSFCATGKMGLIRNLTPWEITAQVRELLVREGPNAVNNVDLMGMGEPLHNWPAVDSALTIMNHRLGLGIGARRITVSTVGVTPGLLKLAARGEQFRLALSVHSPFGDRRQQLMPVERRYPLEEILKIVSKMPRRVTFEYALIRGLNDRASDCRELAKIAKRTGALVNLLALHPGGSHHLEPATAREVDDFAESLRGMGVNATVRRSRGVDINAACGQLWTDASRCSEVSAEHHSNIEEQ